MQGASHQPHSPSLSLSKKSLVVAHYLTSQNLGGKKICLVERVEECIDCCCDKLCKFQITRLTCRFT